MRIRITLPNFDIKVPNDTTLRIHAMYEEKKQQNLHLLDILACNSANKLTHLWTIVKKVFV